MEITDAINYRLEYFRELETATRALSQPGDQVVLEEGFLNMLQRLDACLDFLKMKVRLACSATRHSYMNRSDFLQLPTHTAQLPRCRCLCHTFPAVSD